MKKGGFYIAAATLLFSTMEIALKTVAGVFHPVQLTFTRFFVGGLLLLPFALRMLQKKGRRLSGGAAARFALLGFVGVVVSMTLYQLAVMNTNASVVAVLFSSNPLFVLLFAFFLLREPVYPHNIIAIAVAALGIIVLINPLHTDISTAGVLFTMLATLTFALYGVMGKKQCREYGGVVVTCFGFLFGSAEMFLLSLLSHIDGIAWFLRSHGLSAFAEIPFVQGYTLANLSTVLYVSIGVTGIGYACYFMAMEKTSANTASLVFFFKPALAPILACVILKEAIPLHRAVGILLILCGSLISILPGFLEAKRSLKIKQLKQ